MLSLALSTLAAPSRAAAAPEEKLIVPITVALAAASFLPESEQQDILAAVDPSQIDPSSVAALADNPVVEYSGDGQNRYALRCPRV